MKKAMQAMKSEPRLKLDRALIVEGKDDAAAARQAVDALIIPTHGFGINEETWAVIGKAAEEKGLIILTDPDHAGEQIRKKIASKYPGSVHAYVAREDAVCADDIGVENAKPGIIRKAIETALERADHRQTGGRQGGQEAFHIDNCGQSPVCMEDLWNLGLVGKEGASAARAGVCRVLGIGCCNAGAMIRKLRGFGIDRDELRKAVEEIEQEDAKQDAFAETEGTCGCETR